MAGGKFQDTVELIIAARDQASATVDKVRKKVREANKGQEQFGGKLAQNALRAVAAMGTLELGLGAANAATKALSGSWEDAADAVERLPAGIGPVARQLKEVLGTMTGITAEIDRAARDAERIEKSSSAIVGLIQKQRDFREGVTQSNRELQEQVRLLNLPPDQRAVESRRSQALQLVQEAAAEVRAAEDAISTEGPERQAARRQLDELKTKLSGLREEASRMALITAASGGVVSGVLFGKLGEQDRIKAEIEAAEAGIRNLRRLDTDGQLERLELARETLRLRNGLLEATNSDIEAERRRAAEAREESDREARDRDDELRHEQRLLAIEERRRANREAINDFIERGLQNRIEQIEAEAVGSRRGIINRGGQEITGRFQTGLRDQLAQQRDDPMLEAARQAERTRQSQLKTMQDALRAIQDYIRNAGRPGGRLLPAGLQIGRGF